MKQSKFNILVNTIEKDKFFLFNSLNDSLIYLDKEVLDSLDKLEVLRNNNGEIFNQLLDQGFIIEDNFNEDEFYSFKYYQQRFDKNKTDIMITPTYMCNLRCPYCFEGNKASLNLKGPFLRKVIDFIKNEVKLNESKELEIQLFGGEPFVVKDNSFKILNDLRNWCLKNKILLKIVIYTNGTILDSEILSNLKKISKNIKYVQFSIDGPKHIHNKTRIFADRRGSYDLILENMKKLKNKKIPYAIRINVTQENVNSISELLDDLNKKGLGGSKIYFGFIREMTPACNNKNDTPEVNPNLHLPRLWEETLKRGFNISVKPRTVFNYCSAFKANTLVIDASGSIFKCAGLQGIKEHEIAKINIDGKVSKMKPAYFNFLSRNPLLIEPCSKCSNLPACGGGCACYSYTKHNTYHKPDCFNKSLKLTKEGIRLYLKYQGPVKYRKLF